MPFPFPKAEKLCGKSEIAALLAHGRRGTSGVLRYCWTVGPAGEGLGGEVGLDGKDGLGGDQARILISVPKKYFKRAVKRNLLKRRIREAWRLEKGLLLDSAADMPALTDSAAAADMPVMAGADRPSRRYDILFTYASPEVASYATIREAILAILSQIRAGAEAC